MTRNKEILLTSLSINNPAQSIYSNKLFTFKQNGYGTIEILFSCAMVGGMIS